MEKKSKILYQEIKELEKKLLKIKLITIEESIGKTVKNIHIDNVDFWDPQLGQLIVFTDNTALFIRNNHVETYLSFIWETFWSDYNNEACCHSREEIRFFLEFEDEIENPLYVNIDIFHEILKKAEEYETAKHQESIKEQIQKRLDEISKLKDQL